jgi:hypothetical protein
MTFIQYAMKQPHMCKFLLENGADIDELAVDPYIHGNRS